MQLLFSHTESYSSSNCNMYVKKLTTSMLRNIQHTWDQKPWWDLAKCACEKKPTNNHSWDLKTSSQKNSSGRPFISGKKCWMRHCEGFPPRRNWHAGSSYSVRPLLLRPLPRLISLRLRQTCCTATVDSREPRMKPAFHTRRAQVPCTEATASAAGWGTPGDTALRQSTGDLDRHQCHESKQ